MNILVVNAGSSSLKLSILGDGDSLLWGVSLPAAEGRFDESELRRSLAPRAREIDAVGHRIAHGGTEFTSACMLDAATIVALRGLAPLAPLHQEAGLRAVELVSEALSDRPTVACFDTAFHAHLNAAAATYAVPLEWRVRWGVRRFGFHGLSHAYAWRRTIELMGHSGAGVRVITCHLGSGASLAAILDGESMDTTMGFTPLEGLVMATRSGTIDPGVILWLAETQGLSITEIAHALEHESGLIGLVGTSDVGEIEALASAGHADARLAMDVYVHRLRAGIAAMVSSLGGLDALTFTGGIGEHAAALRADALSGMGFLRLSLDAESNRTAIGDTEVTGQRSRVRVFVVEAREDVQIASEVRSLLL